MPNPFKIVSLCGSAGALTGYIEILQSMPVDSGMVFVVLTHRRTDTTEVLVQILSRATAMRVEVAREGTDFEPNCVYVIPAGQDLTMDGHSFFLEPLTARWGWPNVFDIYLKSVARTTFGRAVTVILSGMDKDGSAFLEELRRGGGINYAQSNAETKSMPKNAIATGMVDFSGSPAEIAKAILNLPACSQALPA